MWDAAGWALGAVVLATLVWAVGIERNWFALRRTTLPVPVPNATNLRVLHLSDLHMAPWQRHKVRWIRGLAKLQPDLVVLTGDALGHRNGLAGVRTALEPFSGVPGVFVNGSNDYFAPEVKNPLRYLLGPSQHPDSPTSIDTAGLMALYAELGWTDLNNCFTAFEVAGRDIRFAGVDDAHLNRDDLSIVTAVSAGDALPPDIVIGVTHAPYRRVLDAMTDSGADVIFAGHTHGGQVCLPQWAGGAIVTNCDLPRRFARGAHRWSTRSKHSWLHVSAGLGTSIFAPVRLFCRPEATLITIDCGARPDGIQVG